MSETLWMVLFVTPADAQVLAFVTTLHCALTVLRKHRTAGNPTLVLLPSLFFTASPWFLSTPLWLAIAMAAHLGWFLACERLIPNPAPPAKAPAPAAVRPSVTPRAAPAADRGFNPLRVLAVVVETSEIRTFRFERPEGFSFRAGQFVIVRMEIGGKQMARCYSISSSPAAAAYLEISVRNQGTVSRFLHENLTVGSRLAVRGPGGPFVYPDGDRPIVLLAGGIGITPLRSMLLHALSSEPDRRVTLVLSAKTADAVPFLDELRALERRHPRFRLAVTLSRQPAADGFLSGRIDRALLESAVDSTSQAVYMICGPAAMIEEMRSLLHAIGVPAGQVHFEKFEAATAAAAASSKAAESFHLTLKKSGQLLAIKAGQTILDAAEAGGASIPSMCRAGVCCSCRTKLLGGEVEGEFDALEERDRAAGFILACIAKPLGDCAIEA